MNDMQIIGIFVTQKEVLQSAFPDGMVDLGTSFQIANLELNGPWTLGCVIHMSFLGRFWMYTLTPVAILTLMIVAYCICGRARRSTKRDNPKAIAIGKKCTKTKVMKMTISLLTFIYPQVSHVVLQMFHCREFADGKSRLYSSDFQLKCFEGIHQDYVGIGILFTLVYPVGVVVIVFVVLLRNRHKMDPSSSEFNEDVFEAFGSIIKNYSKDCWFFEVLLLVHRLFLCSLVTHLRPGTPEQLIAAILWVVLFLTLTGYLNAFRNRSDTLLFSLTQVAIFIVLFDALIRKANFQRVDGYDMSGFENTMIVVSILPIVVCAGVVLFPLTTIIPALCSKKTRQALRERMKSLQSCVIESSAVSSQDATLKDKLSKKDDKAAGSSFNIPANTNKKKRLNQVIPANVDDPPTSSSNVIMSWNPTVQPMTVVDSDSQECADGAITTTVQSEAHV